MKILSDIVLSDKVLFFSFITIDHPVRRDQQAYYSSRHTRPVAVL